MNITLLVWCVAKHKYEFFVLVIHCAFSSHLAAMQAGAVVFDSLTSTGHDLLGYFTVYVCTWLPDIVISV